MAKKITGYIKLQIPAGAANPAPPVGPALGAQGVNIMAFCKEFNARTAKQSGDILPVVIRYATRRANQRGLHHVRFAVKDGVLVITGSKDTPPKMTER